jgi:maltose O-acetyltransferase
MVGVADSGVSTSEIFPTPPRSRLTRLKRMVVSEVEHLNLRLLLATLSVRLLPSLCFSRVRTTLYRRLAGIPIGPHTVILGTMEFTETRRMQARLRIGRHTLINKRFFADLTADITIGDHVQIGHHAILVTAGHEIGSAQQRSGPARPQPIVIENGCWIGARCTILPGVRIGASSVVAAGAVVVESVPPNSMVGGVPARILRTLPADD